ncbi:helix-turn-helix domain-containing protein [Marasmitruncus massiliensis]|uniref:helix-turn-helix domain-containing protein n=1 Tax=Marasmitruncus massiliensis TaxID=1944642 RepID=UPI000C7A8329|nr:helix-turn-helix domain-containing protein [Marasmitruncus massiliensis]MBE6906437.1 MerR family transcriptional regulator [Oscillospiraceae bacterium]
MSRQRSMETILTSDFISIGELVRLTNCRYSTLKFYTEENMLPFEQAEEKLTRRYKREETVARILLIKKLKIDGLSIPQIKEILNKDK